MPVRLAAICVAVLVLALFAPSGASARSAAGPLIRTINNARQANGLPPLKTSPSLSHSAAAWARHLMAVDYFGHAARIRASSRFNFLGEALAMHRGWKLGAAMTVRGWLNSPPHRAVLLGAAYQFMGVGVARGRFGRTPSTILVLQVGSL